MIDHNIGFIGLGNVGSKLANNILQAGFNLFIYDINKNPLTWLDTMLNAVEHMNFFEGRATEYSKASTKGTWAEAFS